MLGLLLGSKHNNGGWPDKQAQLWGPHSPASPVPDLADSDLIPVISQAGGVNSRLVKD